MVELVAGKPPHGTFARIARNENVGHAPVLRLWKLFRTDTLNANDVLSNFSFTRKDKLARLGLLGVLRTARAGVTICSPMSTFL
jgi:hypothetical protein